MAKTKTSPSRKLFLVINYIVLTIVSLMCILPFINLLAISFSDKTAVAANAVSFWPVGFNTAAYEFILGNDQFLRALWISVQRTVLGVLVNIILIILTAYPLSKSTQDFRLRNVFSWFFVVTILFSGGLIPTYMVVKYTGLMDTIWALVLPGAVQVFNMLVVMNYMRSLPKELEEAAYIDGAGHFQTLFNVILPVCTPTLATVTLFSFVGHWNSWYDGMIYMNTVDKYPLQTYLQTIVINPEAFFRNATNISAELGNFLNLVSARTTNAAQLFLATIPILCVYPFLQKYFTTGLVMGSVKGRSPFDSILKGAPFIMNTPVEKKGFIQINIVVSDIERAAEKWADLLGIEKPQIRVNHLEGGENYKYRGRPVSCDLKVCNIEMENFVIELHEPAGGESSFQEFLDKHGNGVHHIGFEVGDKRDTVIAELAAAGYDTDRTVGIYPGSSWTIVDGEDDLGVNLNIKPVR